MENAVKNYKPGERSGNTKQDAVNETLDKATQNLKDNLPADSKTFTDRLKSLVNSTNEVAGKIFKGYAGLSIIGVISALIYRAFKEKDKTLDEIVQGAAGCYQKITDDKGVVYYVGPCKCGFDLENKLSGNVHTMQAQTTKLQTKLKMQHFVKQVPSQI